MYWIEGFCERISIIGETVTSLVRGQRNEMLHSRGYCYLIMEQHVKIVPFRALERGTPIW